MSVTLVSVSDYSYGPARIAADIPYRDGLSNISKGLALTNWNDYALERLTGNSSKLVKPGLIDRTFALLTGILLLVPVVNIVVDLLCRMANLHDLPHHPLDLKVTSDPAQIQRRMAKALAAAEMQRQAQTTSLFHKLLPGKTTAFASCARGILYYGGDMPFKGQSEAHKVGNHDVCIAHMQGRRPTMEDRHLATEIAIDQPKGKGSKAEKAQVFAIFDGHGGDAAAEFVSNNLARYLSKNLIGLKVSTLTGEARDAAIYQALRKTFLELDRAYGGTAGTTACVAVKIGNDLYLANTGDSRAILGQAHEISFWTKWLPTRFWPKTYTVTQLSKDQKAEEMAKSIAKRGGIIAQSARDCKRVNGSLAVARAIGDWEVRGVTNKKAISPLPKITKIANPQGFLFIGCDGIWDVATSDEVTQALIAYQKGEVSKQEATQAIVEAAYKAGSTDNLSGMLVSL